MQFKNLIAFLPALAAAATPQTYGHGDLSTFQGVTYKLHQVNDDVFRGVDPAEWDEKIHVPISTGVSSRSMHTRSEEENHEIRAAYETLARLEDRNFQGFCQAVVGCAVSAGQTIAGLYSEYVTIAAAQAGAKNVMEQLQTPLWANVVGVGIAGIISGQVNGATEKECSTSSDTADAIRGALAVGFQANPSASAVAVTVNGPSGSWTVTVAAEPQGTAPTC